jgi:hypothetical protein
LVISHSTNSHLSGVYIGGSREEYAAIERVDRRVSVASVTLDDACFRDGLPAPHLVKLDIEGAEAAALAGASRLSDEVRPIFVIELHNPECDRAAWEWAARHRYVLRRILDGHVLTSQAEVQHTLLCAPEEHTRLGRLTA